MAADRWLSREQLVRTCAGLSDERLLESIQLGPSVYDSAEAWHLLRDELTRRWQFPGGND